MVPLYFGSSARRLFGIYTPGHGEARAAVLCPPWGQEYISAHRSMRRLAVMLNSEGYHVLTFDYFGTGDSSGEMIDATLEGWRSDIDVAIEELRDMSGSSNVTLVGLRLGATLGADVADRHAEVRRLVLWDPIVLGSAWLEELQESDAQELGPPRTGGRRRSQRRGNQELLGFRLTQTMEQEIGRIDLVARLASLRMPAHIVTTATLPSYKALASTQSSNVRLRHLEAVHAWRLDAEFNAAVPVNVLENIVRGLGEVEDG